MLGEGIPEATHSFPAAALPLPVSPPLPSETCCEVSSSQGCPARRGQVRPAPKRPRPRAGVGELALGEETGDVAKDCREAQ